MRMKKLFSVRSIILAGSLLLQLSALSFQSHGAPGDVDLSFDAGSAVNGEVRAMLVQPDGKVIIGGDSSMDTRCIARLSADGSADNSFDAGTLITNGYVSAVALQPDGKVLIGGAF